MVIDTDTVIEPWAVVIESFNTSVTNSAVFRAWGP